MINLAHFHLILNHGPVFGIPFGLFFLTAGLCKDERSTIERSFIFFTLLTILTGIVFWSGYGATDLLVEQNPDLDPLIASHHRVAVPTVYFSLFMGTLSLAGLFFYRKIHARSARIIFGGGYVLLQLALFALVVWTANLGGRIGHPEIRNDLPFLQVEPDEHEH